MHGIFMVEFQRFVDDRFGAGTWERVQETAGLAGRSYVAVEAYSDEEFGRLVTAARQVSRTPSDVLLEGFGEAVVPGLVERYGGYLDPAWTTLDVIFHTEATFHRVVRRSPGSSPPPLKATRTSATGVQVSYVSPRRLCAVARGICRGLARHFGEAIEIEEPTCMLRGGRTCEIIVRLTSS